MQEDLEALARQLTQEAGNEAETRHKVIDVVLHEVLAWPRARTKEIGRAHV